MFRIGERKLKLYDNVLCNAKNQYDYDDISIKEINSIWKDNKKFLKDEDIIEITKLLSEFLKEEILEEKIGHYFDDKIDKLCSVKNLKYLVQLCIILDLEELNEIYKFVGVLIDSSINYPEYINKPHKQLDKIYKKKSKKRKSNK